MRINSLEKILSPLDIEFCGPLRCGSFISLLSLSTSPAVLCWDKPYLHARRKSGEDSKKSTFYLSENAPAMYSNRRFSGIFLGGGDFFFFR